MAIGFLLIIIGLLGGLLVGPGGVWLLLACGSVIGIGLTNLFVGLYAYGKKTGDIQ